MNMTMAMQILRYVLVAIGFQVVNRGWADSATVEWITGVILTIVPVLWGLWARRPSAQIEAVAAMPNVERVVTDQATAQATPTPNITAR